MKEKEKRQTGRQAEDERDREEKYYASKGRKKERRKQSVRELVFT